MSRRTDEPSAPHALTASDTPHAKLRRLRALVWKETRQIVRDPSSIAMGVILPLILILLFGFGLSLDVKDVPLAVVTEQPSSDATSLFASLQLSPYFHPRLLHARPPAEQQLMSGQVDGILVVPNDFAARVAAGDGQLQLVLRGSDANSARIIEGYVEGAVGIWATQLGGLGQARLSNTAGPVQVQTRLWFNEANDSRYFLVPGLVVLVMTLIGALLTAMVMAREWERGTLEALLVTPVRSDEILLGKTLPYFLLALMGFGLCALSAEYLFHVPLRGSLWVLFGASMLYTLVALGIGLLISTAVKSQLVASQLTMLATFMPAFMLSGFLFDLRSMPAPVRLVTYLLPARYYVALLQSVFLAGDVWSVIIPNTLVLALMAALLAFGSRAVMRKTLGVRLMLEALLRILTLTRKELLAVMKDRRARLSLLIPPVVQAFIFGYAASYDLTRVPYAVLDRDHSAASRALIARLDGSRVFERVADLPRESDIARYIDSRRALLVLQIRQDFERDLRTSQPAALQLIADGRNSNTAGTAVAYVNAIVQQFNADWRHDHGLPASAVQLVERAWFNPNLETRWYMIPGMIGTLTLIQTMMLTVMAVAREREQGTFDQLLVTPFRPHEIMIGKALPSMIVGTIQATGVLLVAQLWFRIPFAGSYLTLYAGLWMFLLAAVGIGLLLSSVAATMQQAMLYSMLFILPFSLLSGFTTPISSMPLYLQYFTQLNPLRYAIDITRRVYLEGAGIGLLTGDLWPLALIALITLSASSWLFRHALQ